MSSFNRNSIFAKNVILPKSQQNFLDLAFLHWTAQLKKDVDLLVSLKGEKANYVINPFGVDTKVSEHQYLFTSVSYQDVMRLRDYLLAENKDLVVVFSCIDERLHHNGYSSVKNWYQRKYADKHVVLLTRAGGASLTGQHNLLNYEMVKALKILIGNRLTDVVLTGHNCDCAGMHSYLVDYPKSSKEGEDYYMQALAHVAFACVFNEGGQSDYTKKTLEENQRFFQKMSLSSHIYGMNKINFVHYMVNLHKGISIYDLMP